MPAPQPAPGSGEIAAIIAAHRHLEGPLLPILHAIQAAFGHIPAVAHAEIALALNISRAEVHGVVSFYHDFRNTPPGRHTVRVCLAEACQAMGGSALRDHARSSLGVDLHQTTADGTVSLEPVYCLGNCACAPAVMIDGDLHGRVSAERFDNLVSNLREAS